MELELRPYTIYLNILRGAIYLYDSLGIAPMKTTKAIIKLQGKQKLIQGRE